MKATFTFIIVIFVTIFVFAEEDLVLPPDCPGKKPHVGVMVSDDHYDADKLLPQFMKEMADRNGWQLTVLHGHGGTNFSNIDKLPSLDVLVIYIRRLALPKDQLEAVRQYVASGKAIVGVRTASHGFEQNKGKLAEGHENWGDFDKEVLGGNYHNHGQDAWGTDVENILSLADSPILCGVMPEKWHSAGSLYFTDPVAENATVYQLGSSPEQQKIPLTWTRMYGKSRVAYTALGHPDDYKEPAFRQLLENLLHWTLRGEVTPSMSKQNSL